MGSYMPRTIDGLYGIIVQLLQALLTLLLIDPSFSAIKLLSKNDVNEATGLRYPSGKPVKPLSSVGQCVKVRLRLYLKKVNGRDMVIFMLIGVKMSVSE